MKIIGLILFFSPLWAAGGFLLVHIGWDAVVFFAVLAVWIAIVMLGACLMTGDE